MNKKHAKTGGYKITIRKWATPLLFGVLFLAIAIQSMFIFYLFKQNEIQNITRLAQLIIQSVDALSRDLPRDPKTGIVYIAEAGLSLPEQPSDLGYVIYSYERADEDFKPVVHLARQNDVIRSKSLMLSDNDSFEKMLSHVAKLHACSRGVTISYDTKNMLEPAGSKVLLNGRTIHFYVEPLCKNQALLDYAKQIDSFN